MFSHLAERDRTTMPIWSVLMVEPSREPTAPAARDSRLSEPAVYSEIASVARVFWEWRHRVISLYLFTVGAVFVLAGWIYEHPYDRRMVALPFALGAAVMVLLAAMDHINAGVLDACYSAGYFIENYSGFDAIYSALHRRSQTKVLTYGRFLQRIYRGSAAALFTLSLAFVFRVF